MRGVASDLLRSLLPARCAGCGAAAEPICSLCLLTLRPAAPTTPPAPLRAWASPFAYEGVAREMIARLKYRNERHALGWLAARTAASARALSGAHAVTHVPTTAERRRKRGFDHAALLARAVARNLGLPHRTVLKRVSGPPQTGRTAAERRRGPDLRVAAPVDGIVWLVVDDVVTTGATLRAAGLALVRAGAAPPLAVSAARTPPPC